VRRMGLDEGPECSRGVVVEDCWPYAVVGVVYLDQLDQVAAVLEGLVVVDALGERYEPVS
jgi:hypothetical protein